jgi:hypothetical protein
MRTLPRLRTLCAGASVVALCAALEACGGGGGSVKTTPPVTVPQEDFFGTGFGVAFRAAANTEPVTPMASDIIPVSLTTEPQPIVFPPS